VEKNWVSQDFSDFFRILSNNLSCKPVNPHHSTVRVPISKLRLPYLAASWAAIVWAVQVLHRRAHVCYYKYYLLFRLSYLAASGGGRETGLWLSKCYTDKPNASFPPSATKLHLEFYAEVWENCLKFHRKS
jgi:hypothetical protein